MFTAVGSAQVGAFFAKPLPVPCVGGRILTVWVFVRQPVVLVAVFKARVPGVALLLSWVTVDVLAFIGVAYLKLVSCPDAGTAPVGWSERKTGNI